MRALVYLLPHLPTRNLKRAGSVIDTTGRVISYTLLPHISSLWQWSCRTTYGGIARFLPLTCIDGFTHYSPVRLPRELQSAVEDHLTIHSLLSLGGTCQYFRDRVSETLTKERDAILSYYWLQPDILLQHLTWNRAVISGEAALAFILRDRALLTDELEICVSAGDAYELLQWFHLYTEGTDANGQQGWPAWNTREPTVYRFRSPMERAIRVISSHNECPLTPITFYPTTALFNYFDEFSFGCAYRDLTMNRRAVVPELSTLNSEVATRVEHIGDCGGFEQSQWPSALALGGTTHEELANTACLRREYMCPGQSRFFGDPGTLVEFFAPDLTDHAVMAHLGFAPYGTTAIWRMRGAQCDRECVSGDYLLRDSFSEPSNVVHRLCYGPFTSSVVGQIMVGETEHEWVIQSTTYFSPLTYEHCPDEYGIRRRGTSNAGPRVTARSCNCCVDVSSGIRRLRLKHIGGDRSRRNASRHDVIMSVAHYRADRLWEYRLAELRQSDTSYRIQRLLSYTSSTYVLAS